MGDTKNLVSREAIAKIKHIASGEIAMLCTFDLHGDMDARPMATQGIADDGTFWYFCSKDSTVSEQVLANPAVQVIYMVPGKSEYLVLDGTASISRDRAKLDELWTSWAKAWFPEGKDDPDLTLLTVTLTGGHYWDTRNGRMVSLAKIALAAVTGKPMDGGVEGALKL